MRSGLKLKLGVGGGHLAERSGREGLQAGRSGERGAGGGVRSPHCFVQFLNELSFAQT